MIFTLRLALPALLFLALIPTTPADAAFVSSTCDRTYTRAMFHSAARSTFRHPVVPSSKRKTLRRIVVCQRRAVSRRIVRRSLRRYKAKHAQRFYWQVRFYRMSPQGQAWSHSTAACESDHGRNPRTNLNGFRGIFQWVMATWYAAGGTGDPAVAGFYHEAVLAWPWHLSHPSGQWPNCGE